MEIKMRHRHTAEHFMQLQDDGQEGKMEPAHSDSQSFPYTVRGIARYRISNVVLRRYVVAGGGGSE